MPIPRVTPLPCGCIPHETRMTNWGFYCDTEQQGYCNFECPHNDEDDDNTKDTLNIVATDEGDPTLTN